MHAKYSFHHADLPDFNTSRFSPSKCAFLCSGTQRPAILVSSRLLWSANFAGARYIMISSSSEFSPFCRTLTHHDFRFLRCSVYFAVFSGTPSFAISVSPHLLRRGNLMSWSLWLFMSVLARSSSKKTSWAQRLIRFGVDTEAIKEA